MRQERQHSDVSQELRDIYRNAWKDGIWLREFLSDNGFVVAAGSVAVLRTVHREIRQSGRSVPALIRWPEQFAMGDCIFLGAEPGSGKTREEACRDAISKYKQHR